MNHPPFDTQQGREALRALLNEIPRVSIAATRLGGRPQIALTKLVHATSRERLIGVLDRVVDETRRAALAASPIGDEASVGPR